MLSIIAISVILVLYLVSTIRSIISIIGIITNVYKKVWLGQEPPLLNGGYLPSILVVLPAYRENPEDIRKTLESIVEQDYPRDLVRIAVVVEPDDKKTLYSVEQAVKAIEEKHGDIGNLRVIIKPGLRRSKATALNYAIKSIRFGDIIAVYDGGDIVRDKRQFLRAALKILEGYDIVGSRVYRTGTGMLGKLVFFDTLIWIKIGLPSLARILKTPLVSGEGLFVRRSFIEKAGGFPERLTEDAFLTIYSYKYGARIFLLASDIVEASPANITSLIRQRLRWYRGHLECFFETIKTRGISLSGKTRLLLAYTNPLLISSISIAYIVLALSLIQPLEPLVALLSLLVVLTTFTAPFYIIGDVEPSKRRYLVLLPIYWFFLGTIALFAILAPIRIKWYKTLQRSSGLS